jgi:type II secretory ATPase GspE/PulE/Tfp pilus assembly ATPase PilB-like protein
VRYRIDGVMILGPTLPKALQNAVVARLKIISEANIAETRLPQDGRIRFTLGKKQVDIRVSFFPVIYGENVVLRVLDKSRIVIGLEKLGMGSKQLEMFKDVIERTYGLILVTGPTGSGKTTTLYSALAYLNSLEKNIVTLEDPVEYEFPIIRQSQVNYRINYTFADGLRTILRQDPDIILVGEMRDQETIDMAIRSALTGHLVMSTLHTNNAVSTIGRLTDMGAEPFLIASTILMVISQRLVRKICDNCRTELDVSKLPEHITRHLPAGVQYFTGAGCERCNHSGFKGRIAIFEMLAISEKLRMLIEKNAPNQELSQQARQDGLKTLFDDALEKARKGVISPEEAVRIAIGM